ncbi:MAG: hypothetical protein WCY88_10895 [Spongiibacteraceae bacterium]
MSKLFDGSRRSILKLLPVCMVGFLVPRVAVPGPRAKNTLLPDILHLALAAWNQSEKVSPEEYLEGVNIHDYEEIKVSEFNEKQMIIVDGFVLCKSEVAVLATIASRRAIAV